MDYDRVAFWATLGQDAVWRRRALALLPRGRADVLDYACGTGLLTLAAARRCVPGRVVGVDLSADMLAQARAKAAAQGLAIEFVEADAEEWEPPRAAFDVVMTGYLPKYVAMDRWLPRVARALRPGGLLLAHDFTHPTWGPARRGWDAWWSFLQPRLARVPAWREVAEELPGLVRHTRWREVMVEELPRRGFVDVRARSWCFGAAAMVEARRATR